MMIGLLGHSATWQHKKQENKFDAILALIGLYIMLLLPITMALKRWVAEGLCIGLVLIFLLHSYRKHDWRWLREPMVAIALSIWVYSVVIVTPLAIDPILSLERIGWVRFPLMLAAIVYWLSDYRKEVKRIAFFTLIFLLFVAADAFMQYVTGMSFTGHPIRELRLTGPFKKVIVGIYLAKMSLPCIGMLLYYAWEKRRVWQMAGLITAMTLIFIVILLSNERTATITFIAAMAMIGSVLFVRVRALRLWVCIVALLQMSVLYGVNVSQSRMQERAKESSEVMSDFWNSPYGQLWKGSYLTWTDNPVVGAGMKNFRVYCKTLEEQGRVHYCNLHSHNVFMEFLSEMGSIGFLGLLALIASFVVMILRQRSPHNINMYIVTMFAMANIVINFFPLAVSQSIFANWPGILAWQSIAWALAIARSEGRYGRR